MKRSRSIRMVVSAAMVFVLVIALTGCTFQAATDNADETTSDRQYMADVNQVMAGLKTSLADFGTALSEENIVSMKTQADEAAQVVADLEKIEPPDTMKDVHSGYVEGTKKLQEAFEKYLDLYTQIATASEAAPFDYNTYEENIDEVKKIYDEGIEKLEEADKKATETVGAEQK